MRGITAARLQEWRRELSDVDRVGGMLDGGSAIRRNTIFRTATHGVGGNGQRDKSGSADAVGG